MRSDSIAPISVLFMDDEVHSSTAVLVGEAVRALEAAGYAVTAVDRMSAAVDAFYEKFYKVFVLDIDMGASEDVLNRKGERGTKVAELYRALDNGTAVIMFSARGVVEDWFRVGNRHVFGYVFKNETNAIARLVEVVGRAAAGDTRGLQLPMPRQSGPVLVCNAGSGRFGEADLQRIVGQAGDFQPVFCSLEEMEGRLAGGDFAAALLLADCFETVPDVQDAIDAVCKRQPVPQVVTACEGRPQYEASILHLINARPFRLVNLLAGDAGSALAQAVREAAYWQGGNEVFTAESEYVHKAAERIDWTALDEAFASGPDEETTAGDQTEE